MWITYEGHFKDAVHAILDSYGATRPEWRVKIVGTSCPFGGDWCDVNVEVYLPRMRKPHVCWTLHVDDVRKIVNFDKGKSYATQLR